MQKYPNISRASHLKRLFLTPCGLARGLGPHGGGPAIWTTWPDGRGREAGLESAQALQPGSSKEA